MNLKSRFGKGQRYIRDISLFRYFFFANFKNKKLTEIWLSRNILPAYSCSESYKQHNVIGNILKKILVYFKPTSLNIAKPAIQYFAYILSGSTLSLALAFQSCITHILTFLMQILDHLLISSSVFRWHMQLSCGFC